MVRSVLHLTGYLAFVLAQVAVFAPASAGEWEPISQQDGIRVWRRAVAGSAIIEFKGQVRLEAPIRQVTAVIYDHKHRHEWMARTAVPAQEQHPSDSLHPTGQRFSTGQ